MKSAYTERTQTLQTQRGIRQILSVVITMLALLTSCVDESSRSSSKTITSFGTTSETYCETYYDVSSLTCRSSSCASGTHEADADEISAVLEELEEMLEDEDITEDEYDEIYENLEAAETICVDGSGILRPTDQVYIDGDVCACQDGLPASINDCESFCASEDSTESITVFGDVTLGSDILLNDELGNLYNWCYAEIDGSDYTGPGCSLEVWDGDAYQYLSISISEGSNSFTAVLDNLDQKVTYIMRIKETESGSEAQSEAWQLYLKEYTEEDEDSDGPLNVTPVSQYTCIYRATATDSDGDVNYTEYARQHFYFASDNTPSSLPDDTDTIICHDVQTYGDDDSSLYPRLELTTAFVMWNQDDSRFNDSDSDGTIDVNEDMTEDYKSLTNQEDSSDVELELFSVFSWNNIPEIDGWKSSTEANLGLIMIPFIGEDDHADCPVQADYLGDNTLYNLIGDYVGVDTEGIYMAESEPYSDGSSTIIDIIIVPEAALKEVWFYYEDGQYLVPDDDTAETKTIRFYYPMDPDAPYIQKASQTLYTVRYPDEIGTDGTTTGIITGTRPPDNRFACVPASEQASKV